MHIIIAAITAIAGLIWALYALQNAGVDLNAFNPFTWARRRKWEKLYGSKPIYNLTKPMEAAAAIMVGVLKQEGEVSREQKQEVIDLFKANFMLSDQDAVELFASSAHLVKDEVNLDQSIKYILKPSMSQFTPDMASSFIELLDKVSKLEGTPSKSQISVISNVKSEIGKQSKPNSKWG